MATTSTFSMKNGSAEAYRKGLVHMEYGCTYRALTGIGSKTDAS